LGKIPLPKMKLNNEPFVNLANKMESLNQRLSEIGDKKTDERAGLDEEMQKTDYAIDELVYEIYGLTDTEKKTIEDSLKLPVFCSGFRRRIQ